jgi:hypothetical protein
VKSNTAVVRRPDRACPQWLGDTLGLRIYYKRVGIKKKENNHGYEYLLKKSKKYPDGL